MLDVQRFQPLPQPSRSSRHHPLVIERGRSRDVSPAAITRKASEERRKRAARILSIQVEVACAHNRATSPVASTSLVSSANKTTADSTSIQPPHASSSTSLPTGSYSSSEPSIPSAVPSSSSTTRDSRSLSPPCEVREEEEDDDEPDLPPPTLQDEMQEAYAACQAVCGPRLTASRFHRCPHIHRARILCLKTQGIEVTSDKDPRINAVRDEDFVFVPPGALTLDEETQAAFQAERARREKEALARQQHEREEAEKRRVQEARRREIAAACASQRLEFKAKKTRPTYTTTTSGPLPSRMLKHSQRLIAPASFKPESSPERNGSIPGPVSFKAVSRSLRGPLFPGPDESEIREYQRCTLAQARLLDSLLEPVVWEEGERSSQVGRYKESAGTRNWLHGSPSLDPNCLACSVGSDSAISRTNSWASSTSDEQTSSTNITSPSSSPSFGKVCLPPLIEDKVLRHRQPIVHSCHPSRRTQRISIALNDSPLCLSEADQLKSEVDSTESSATKAMSIKSKLVSRVRQSVVSFVDFASRVQQSYMRTVQFSVTMPDASMAAYYTSGDEQSAHKRKSKMNRRKPEGSRASSNDVRRFAPQPEIVPIRDLNFTSETNIPLGDPHGSPSSTLSPNQTRVFTPVAFVPPSPLRPRYPLIQPEWRLRPVANPCVLRLKALANVLGSAGIAWEGRAHSGSLGCGRERLTGVAFEGLGGSRLAFESK